MLTKGASRRCQHDADTPAVSLVSRTQPGGMPGAFPGGGGGGPNIEEVRRPALLLALLCFLRLRTTATEATATGTAAAATAAAAAAILARTQITSRLPSSLVRRSIKLPVLFPRWLADGLFCCSTKRVSVGALFFRFLA